MSDNSGTRGLWGGLRVAVLALLWGSTFLWIELALRGLSPLQVTLARCVLGALVLVVACYTTGQRLPRGVATWRHVVVAAFFCNALPFALFSMGQQTVDSGLAGVLNATTPLWSIALGLALGSERGLRPVRLAGLLLGFTGTIVIFAPWQTTGATGWGALAILGAAASYAVAFTYMGRTLVRRGTPTISLSAAQLVAASGLTALAVPIGGLESIDPGPTVLVAAVVLSVFCTAITFHLTYRIINDEGATNAAVVGYSWSWRVQEGLSTEEGELVVTLWAQPNIVANDEYAPAFPRDGPAKNSLTTTRKSQVDKPPQVSTPRSWGFEGDSIRYSTCSTHGGVLLALPGLTPSDLGPSGKRSVTCSASVKDDPPVPSLPSAPSHAASPFRLGVCTSGGDRVRLLAACGSHPRRPRRNATPKR